MSGAYSSHKKGLSGWIKAVALIAGLGSLLMLTACGGDDGPDDRLGLSKPALRVINAFPDGPTVDVATNGTNSASGLAYLGVKAYYDVSTGSTTVTASLTGTTAPISTATFNAATGHKYTYAFVAGTSATNDAVLIDDPYEKGLLSTQARVRILNAAFNAGSVDVYVLKATDNLASAVPVAGNVGFKTAYPASGNDSIDLDGGSVTVVVTNAGSKTPIFTSTATSLDDNADWLITVVPQQGISAVTPNSVKVLVVKTNDTDNPGFELTAAS
ncbi:hypothetical protein HNQ50_002211 [Silvimonas terrae]|uniref:DUF4397 domain-containing protein n=1 Tax=Silvimonas terrae TaxID=300266 RepID=A0A840RGY3_9NEIS|nr:DUF4397 domain-containing protein [Silvimonas terrae]MBB5191481.1 hypothetical protein [Silvimonas terrae]